MDTIKEDNGSFSPRKLKGSEEFFHIINKNYGFALSASVIVQSTFEIRKETIYDALKLLSRAHPLLRSKITTKGPSDRDKYYFHEITNFMPNIISLDTTSTSWQQSFEESLECSLDSEAGSLWSVAVLKPKEDVSVFTQTLIFKFHHGIVDGRSILNLCLELLQYIQQLHTGVTPSVESHALMPSSQTLLGNQVKRSWLTKKLASVLINSYVLSMVRGDTENQFLSLHPPISEITPNVERKTKVFCFSLPPLETNRIVTLCKTYAVSLDAFINAVCARAMAWILNSNYDPSKQQPLKIYSGSVLDMRQRVKGDKMCCGCYVSKVPCPTEVYPFEVDNDSLWKLSQQCTRTLEVCVENEKDLESYKLGALLGGKIQDVMTEEHKASRAGRLGNEVFVTHFCGHHSQSSEDSIRIKEAYIAATEHEAGPVFANNVCIVGTCLCWTLTYYSNISGKVQAGLFYQHIKSVIQSLTS